LTESITQKIVRNTIFNTIGRFWSLCISILFTPYLVKHLGTDSFGIWALISVLTGYFGLLDFGVGTSFVKYIAEYHAKKDFKQINLIISTGFIFYFLLGMAMVAIMIFIMNPLLRFLHIPPELHHEASFAFIIGIALFALSNAVSPFKALQTGLQRMDITNIVAIISSIPYIAGTIYALEKGYGLRGLIINYAIIVVAICIANIAIGYYLISELKFRFAFFQKTIMKKLFDFGYKVQIAVISEVITTQTDKLLITIMLTIAMVTYYQLGNVIVQAILSITTLLVSALTPAFAEMEARGERKLLTLAYLRMTKYLAFVSIPLFIFIMFFASEIMQIWMGTGYERSALIVQILCIGWLINKIAHVGASVSMAIEKPQLMANGSIIIIVLNIILSIVLIKLFGFSGVAWGTSIAVTIGTIYFLIVLNKHLGIPLKTLLNTTVPSLIISLMTSLTIFSISSAINYYYFTSNRIILFAILALKGLLYGILYLIITYYARLFDQVDIDLFKQRIPYFQKLIKK
jgi:O-antigen/teichoic acid export membrane protein